MTTLGKAGIAIASVGAVGGATTYGIYEFNKADTESNQEQTSLNNSVSFKDKLGVSVLSLTGETEQTQWTTRLKELSEAITNLPADLTSLKTGKGWKDLQQWCNTNSTSVEVTSTNYQNFETFCTWKVGDKDWTGKISADTPNTDQKWGTAHAALKKKPENTLSSELKEIHKKTSSTEDEHADKKAMHKWCIDSYKKIWTGESDETLKEVKEYCKN
ncbi:hypothetical protein A6V39_00650 [Candidatus Mycoplasma haematobovis]|uniref:Uncharacterized protein n=1 Tax=Candidatus Mycoplasma haematobovis TaxID=432608 RepID=A0A1A9QFT5_9MOLU|nr:hypothetical protein [Candidatus Mycoplasma haematobovis]OAL10560.1 hypothetical protein A6V39_00650 [Candidatus Mycoplasma haematobovis]